MDKYVCIKSPFGPLKVIRGIRSVFHTKITVRRLCPLQSCNRQHFGANGLSPGTEPDPCRTLTATGAAQHCEGPSQALGQTLGHGVTIVTEHPVRLTPPLSGGFVGYATYEIDAVSSGFKREAMPIKNNDVQSLICWSHVPCPGGFQTGARGGPTYSSRIIRNT